MATITFGATAGNWSDATKWVGGVRPTAADDVLITVTGGNVTIDSATLCVCRSLDCTGYVGTMDFGSGFFLKVGDGSGGACKFVAGMTITLSGGTLTLQSSSTNGGTGWAVTTGGKTLPGVSFSGGGGKWVLQDALTSASTLAFSQGTLDTSNQSVSCATFVISGSGTRTLTMGSSSITCTGSAATAWNGGGTNLTVTANTATVTLSGSFATFSGSSTNWNGLTATFTGGSLITVTSTGTLKTINYTGTASIADALVFTSSMTLSSNLVVTGNSGANRVLVSSGTIGTAITLTVNGTVNTSTNCDFRDITSAGTASWDLSGQAGVGDCLGNTGITCTPAVTRYGVVAGNWTATATWSTSSGGAGGASVPLPQDTARLDPSSAAGTYSLNHSRPCKDLTCTGFTRTLSVGTAHEIYGSVILGAGMTYSGTATGKMVGRGSHTITSNGVAFTNKVNIDCLTGTYTLQDAFADSRSIAGCIAFVSGTFTANGQNVTQSSTAATATVLISGGIVNMGSGTWTLAGTVAGNIWDATGGTINGQTSTIAITTATANTRTFNGNGQTYNILTYTVAGSTGKLSVTGNNTFTTINFSDATNARTLEFANGSTTTITGTFSVFGTSGKLMSVTSVTGGTTFTLSKASGIVSCNYLSLKDSIATGGATWYAGANSTNVSGNTGWIFTDPVTAPATISATTTLPTPGLATTPTPTTIAVTASLPAPTIDVAGGAVDATATPATIAAAAQLGAATVTGSGAASPSTIAATTSLAAPAVTATGAAGPSTVQATSTVDAPTITATGAASPSTIDATVTIDAVTVTATSETAPSTVNAIAAIAAPTIQATATTGSATVTALATIPTPTSSAASAASTGTVTATTQVGATITATAAATASTISVTVTVGPVVPTVLVWVSVTVRERGHTATIIETGHHGTVRERGHTSTFAEQGG